MMNILEELELVRGRLTKPDKVDPNAIFAELEKQHTNKPRLGSDKVVEEVILIFNRRTEENADLEIDDTILEEDDKSIISLGDSDTCLESVEESLNLGLNPDQGLLDLVNNNEPNNNQGKGKVS
ncbi:uncharacterized protein LOC111715168 [Eurytemora carolleeae]|uniref:uncharacterized protein LOC111715168 n=1 Tax=Eurytemora carolleeae TaxID=1294199 RepID=UPI000C75BBA8|nr:uncharacterized protein LOC111715168 [Eurytemora carolleeae]|eukprot:XP_023346211.1 uncharacterized protein LOC111715168 [Eurytemora affinis]